MLRADIARPGLGTLLQDAGAKVTEVVAYQTKSADRLPDEALEALRDHRVDWITFSSSSTARNLVDLLGAQRSLLAGIKTASIGPVTSRTLHEVGLAVTVEAEPSNVPGLIQAFGGG